MAPVMAPVLALAAAAAALTFGSPAARDALSDAQALWEAGRRLEAVARLADAGDLDAGARLALVRWELAVHRYAAALEHAEGLDERADPLRGLALYRLGRFAEAVPLLDPSDGELCLRRIDALEALGRFDEAAELLDDLARALGAEHAEVLALRGHERARAGDDEGAVRAFRRALAADPVHGAATFGLGRALLRLDRADEALAVLERHRALVPLLDQLEFARQSLDLDPLHGPNHALVGDARRALGRLAAAPALLAQAERDYERACELAAADELVPIALRLARLRAEDLGDVDRAVAALDAAAARADDVRLAVRAGDVLLDAGRAAEAARRYETALAARPGDPQIVARLERARAARAEGGR